MMDYSSQQPSLDTKNLLSHYSQDLTYFLGELKHVFDQRDTPERLRKSAYERLGDISKVMRIILEKYPSLKSKELLLNSSRLIQSVKQYDYYDYSLEQHSKLMDHINALYRSFHFNVSNHSMQDNLTLNNNSSHNNNTMASSTTSTCSSSSMFQQNDQSIDVQHQHQHNHHHHHHHHRHHHHHQSPSPSPTYYTETVDKNLIRKNTLTNQRQKKASIYDKAMINTLDELMKQAKLCSKYFKDLLTTIEKHLQIENDYNRSLMKNAQSFHQSIQQMNSDSNSFLPFNEVYDKYLQDQLTNVPKWIDGFESLAKDDLQILNETRLAFERQLKKIKEEWTKENKQLSDFENNFRKQRESCKLSNDSKPRTSMADSLFHFHETPAANPQDQESNYNKFIWQMNSQQIQHKKVQAKLIERLKELLLEQEKHIKLITIRYFQTLKSPQLSRFDLIDRAFENAKSYKEFSSTFFSNDYVNNETMVEMDSSESSDNQNGQFIICKSSKDLTREMPTNYNFNNFNNSSGKTNKIVLVPKRSFFGVKLTNLSSSTVPDIIKQCIKQIEARGSKINGIYRVSAVKSQVENLCNNYEKNPSNVDLSSVSPNVIANFLKHFFRMLPEPLLTFQLYPALIEIATKYSKSNQSTLENEDEIVMSLKKILKRLPAVHYNTLKLLINHLKQISNDSAINQMNPSNLGIVFGPTLVKKSNDDNNALLYDTNHQSRIIELLILYSDRIFDSSSLCHSDSESSIHRTASIGSKNGDSTLNNTNNNNDNRRHQLLKSATCSSIRSSDAHNQRRNNIQEARSNFFATSLANTNQTCNAIGYKQFTSYNKNCNNDIDSKSPFTQISTNSSPNQSALRQKTNSFRHSSQAHDLSASMNNESSIIKSNIEHSNKRQQIYTKHNQLSKSSSELYSYSKKTMSPLSREDHV